ncbi:MAG: GlxA family transcriptional regulator [Alphaproteobacteria bacterium]
MVKPISPHHPFRIGFLLIDGFALMSYAATIEPLRAANLLSGQKLYEIDHLAPTGPQSVSSSGAVVEATTNIGARADFDLVLVVAGGDPVSFLDKAVFQWLRHLATRGVPLGGVSGGPVILAAAGLMAGRRMTVHWEHAAALAEISPPLLVTRTLYVIDRDRLTCAGGVAPLDMMHSFIADRHGPNFARQVSDWFLNTQIRPSVGPQRAGLVERYRTTSAAVIRAIDAMENHIADPLTLDQIADLAGVGPRQLNRLFHQKINATTMTFYRDLRLDSACKLLDQTSLTITEIALATGFASSAHFSHLFRRRYGGTPSSSRSITSSSCEPGARVRSKIRSRIMSVATVTGDRTLV